MKPKREAVLKYIRDHAEAPVAFRELMQVFGVTKAVRESFKHFVDSLVSAGDLLKMKGNRYTIPEGTNLVTGRLSCHRDGFGFVTPEGGGDDIYIPARSITDNMHGDLVEVRIEAIKRFGKREGRIVRTVERGYRRIVGRFEASRGFGYVIPDETRITQHLYVPQNSWGRAKSGQVVVAEITSYPTSRRKPEGRIVEVLGWPDEPDVEVQTIVTKYELPYQFSPEVLSEARSISQQVTEADRKGRNDLRGRLTVTIDGETARDFDDAVSVQQEGGGDIRLWVSIADVSHYVRPGSHLDTEAYGRATSVYFPDRCIPMLPEELSNGICSLNPQVERLTLTAEMLFGKAGDMKEALFYPSVIKSDARLTYTIVKNILVDEDTEAVEAHRDLVGDLKVMEKLAVRLTEKRRKRGSIDFDLPEPQIILDLQGQTESIVRAERNLAHRIIEEFMLAANEAVATRIEERNIPSLYRVHEPPDPAKLNDFREFIFNFGYEFRMTDDQIEPAELQHLLEDAAGKPEERMINEVLLRCMKQARYDHENLGHFGLAARCYTHFTSPIRRYPDLVVHRILKSLIAGKLREKEIEKLAATLPDVGVHTSRRERIAMEAEREIVELKKMQFMQGKLGETFDGYITGVSPYGFYVELVDLFVEGMVHISTMKADYYRYEEKQHSLIGERTKERFRIGDKVRVLVAGVSLERKQVEFVLAGSHEERADSRGEREIEEYAKIPIRGKRPDGMKSKVSREVDRRGGNRPKGGGRRKGRR